MNRHLVLACALLVGCGSASSHPDAGLGPGVGASVTLLSPYDGQLTNSAELLLSATVSGATPTEISFWIDGSEQLASNAPQGSPYQFEWDAGVLADGTHAIYARALFDGGFATSPTHHFVIDRTPPQVVSVEPDPSVPSVCVSEPFTVHFSEPIARWADAGAICTGCPDGLHLPLALLFGDGGVQPSTADLTDGGDAAFALAASFAWGDPPGGVTGPLTLEVPSPGLTDLAGNPLPPFQQTWQLDPNCVLRDHGAAWSIPNLDRPTLALDASLNVYVAGVRSNGTTLDVVVYRYASGGWTELGGPLNAVPGQSVNAAPYNGDVLAPGLAIDSQGNPWVAFYESDGTLENGYVFHWNGTGWSQLGGAINPFAAKGQSVRVFNPASVVTPGYPRVPFGLDANDQPFLAITEPPDVGLHDHLFLVTFTGGGWSSVFGVSNDTQWDVIYPTLATDHQRRIYVAYVQHYPTDAGTYYTPWAARWDPSVPGLEPVADSVNHPANFTGQQITSPLELAVSDNGYVYLAFVAYDASGTRKNLYVARAGTDQVWTQIGELNASIGNDWPDDSAALTTFSLTGIDQVQLTFLENVSGQGTVAWPWLWNDFTGVWTFGPTQLLPLGSGEVAQEAPGQAVHDVGEPVTALVQTLDGGEPAVFVQHKYFDSAW